MLNTSTADKFYTSTYYKGEENSKNVGKKEVPVLCLVTEDKHSRKTAYSAEQHRKEDKHLFRYPKGTRLGKSLVNKIQSKGYH